MLLTLLGAAASLPALHFSVVAHELCAEHGELEHVSSEAPLAAPTATERAALLPLVRAEHEHERCGVLATSSSRALLVRAELRVAVAATLTVRSFEAISTHAHRSVALLAYAPKLAPPV